MVARVNEWERVSECVCVRGKVEGEGGRRKELFAGAETVL